MFHAGNTVKAWGGKAFSFASIGEVGEKAFPAGADGSNELPEPIAGMNREYQSHDVDSRVVSQVNALLKDYRQTTLARRNLLELCCGLRHNFAHAEMGSGAAR